MIGFHRVIVKNKRCTYDFELHRNITVLKGNSGSGKTTLFEMISEYYRYGKSSGVGITSDKTVVPLTEDHWESRLSEVRDSIVVIDEDSFFVRSRDFAAALKGSDNYYLLITRNYLSQLPYSVNEVYELTGTKNHRFKRVYENTAGMYDRPLRSSLPFRPDIVIVEDSKSGFQFFSAALKNSSISCVSAEGKTNIVSLLKKYSDQKVLVIADGAAFGSEMEDLVSQQKLRYGSIGILLPESFEWLIMKAGVIEVKRLPMLENPQDYADSRAYLSWEQYFTALLREESSEHRYQMYSKSKLSSFYRTDQAVQLVLSYLSEAIDVSAE